jgi:hypothetical protein
MKKWLALIIFVCLALLLALFIKPTDGDEQKTLASLIQIDSFPLYEMHFYADYGFDNYLRGGSGKLPIMENGSGFGSLSWGCTGFAALDAENGMIFGRNFDWRVHPAMVLFTDPLDAYASVSIVDISYLGYGTNFPEMRDRQALLRAPYLPFDGMNEKGLAVGMMAVDYANGGTDPSKMTLEDLDVIRLLLDYAATVDEGIALLGNYNVLFEEVPLHYMLADRQGNSAVLEYLDGQIMVIRSEHPWQVSTNFIVSEEKPQGATSSCWRYNKAYQALEQAGGSLSEDEAFDLLQQVSQGGNYPTIWSVVYDLNNGQVRVVVDRKYDLMYTFQVGK